ncbi:MAG: DRTGG domain-containing protein [Clostridia bacterium]|jgi:predicted transcriptional regulator|nr:DRTGG domain-containing protein [Clostridia bacterium]MDD4146538.1 DRTGG domain-containing protein [Clostridia bacterium]
MTLAEIAKLLNAVLFTDLKLDDIETESACGSDLLSDVLAFTKEKTLLLTGLVHPQVLRTVEMVDLVGVVFVRGKAPSKEIIELAQEKGIPLLSTVYPMYEACGLLYQAGLPGNSQLNSSCLRGN